jgi:hypothetical protein
MSIDLRLVCVLFFIFSVQVFALDQFPIPLNKHIKEADVIIDAVFISEFKLSGTEEEKYEASFKVIRSMGLGVQSVDKNYLLKIKYSQKEDIYGEFIDFQKKERVVLFLEKNENELQLLNDAASKYSVIKRSRKWIMVSEVFPFHPMVGQVNIENFINLVEKEKMDSFYMAKSSDIQKYLKGRKGFSINNIEKAMTGRKIASNSNTRHRVPANHREKSEEVQLNIFWLMTILALLAGLSRIISRKDQIR